MPVAAILIFAASIAGTARAGFLQGDPRQCEAHDARACARESARLTLRHVLVTREGFSTVNEIDCRSDPLTILRWRCSFHDSIRDGVAVVSFRHTLSGWTRRVTVVSLIVHWPCCSPG